VTRDSGRLRTPVVALLLVLAGCSAAPGFGPASSPPPPDGTVTPAPVPESGETRTPTGPIPGVSARGVSDPTRLVSAHEAALANASYTVRLTTTRRSANGTLRSRYRRVVRLSGSRFHYVLHQTDRAGNRTRTSRVERYGDGDHLYLIATTGTETTYRVHEGGGGAPTLAATGPGRLGLGWLLGLLETNLTDTRTQNGTTLYRLVGGPLEGPPLRNLSLVAFVDARGVVREYHVSYAAVRDGELVRVRVDVAYTDIETTTVARPAWVAEAENATRTATRGPPGDTTSGATTSAG